MRPERRQRVQTRSRRPTPFTMAWTCWRFGRHRRFVLLFAWLTFEPTDRCLPQTSHARAMGEGGYHGDPALATSRRSRAANAPDDVARRNAGNEVDALDASAAGEHLVAADDVVGRPVRALHEDIGGHRGDERLRGIGVERHDVIDGGETREHLGTLRDAEDRPAGTLETSNRRVVVQTDDEDVTERACRGE